MGKEKIKHLYLVLLVTAVATQLSIGQSYQWAHDIGSTGGDWGRGVAVDTISGSVYATGYFKNSIDCDPGPGTAILTSIGLADAYIVKYDASGNYLWAFNIGSPDADYGNGIVYDHTSGSIYVIGAFGDSADFDPGVGTDFRHALDNKAWFLAKYDSSGNYLWAIDGEGAYSDAHGLSYNPLYDHIAVSGEFFDSLDFDPGPDTALLSVNGNTDNFIVNYDGSGNYQWGINIGNSNYDFMRDLATEYVSNSVYVTGSFYDTLDLDPSLGVSELIAQGGQDAYIAKYDSTGNYLWAFGLGAATHDAGSALTYNQTFGALTVTGVFNGTIDFDPDTGIASLNSQGNSMYVANYTSSGGYQWAFKVAGTTVNGYGITTDEQYGSIYLTGNHYGMADFDPGPGSGVLTVPGWSNMYVAKYDAFGNYKWAFGIGLSDDQTGLDIATNSASRSVYVTGWFESTADFDPGTSTANLTPLGSQDVLVAKYTDCDINPMTLTSVSIDSATCIGISDGRAVVNVSGGIAPFTYVWNSMDTLYNDTLSELSFGVYNVDVYDQDKCLVDTSFTMSNKYLLSFNNTNQNVSCFGGSDGIASVTGLGGTPPYSYLWTQGDTTSSIDSLSSGSYPVSMVDSLGCTSSSNMFINEPPLIAEFDTVEICPLDSVMLQGSYQNSAGNYLDSLSSVNNCDSIISTLLIVNPLPTVSFTGLDSVYCINAPGNTLIGFPVGGVFNGTGTVGSQFQPDSLGIGTFTITYEYTDSNNCTETAQEIVIIENCNSISWKEQSQRILVYPNPTKGKVDVVIEGSTDTQWIFSLRDIRGQVVMKDFSINKPEFEIDLFGLVPGMYFMILKSDTGSIRSKVIKH